MAFNAHTMEFKDDGFPSESGTSTTQNLKQVKIFPALKRNDIKFAQMFIAY